MKAHSYFDSQTLSSDSTWVRKSWALYIAKAAIIHLNIFKYFQWMALKELRGAVFDEQFYFLSVFLKLVKCKCISTLVSHWVMYIYISGKLEKKLWTATLLELQSVLGCVQWMQHLQQTPNVLSFQHAPWSHFFMRSSVEAARAAQLVLSPPPKKQDGLFW